MNYADEIELFHRVGNTYRIGQYNTSLGITTQRGAHIIHNLNNFFMGR